MHPVEFWIGCLVLAAVRRDGHRAAIANYFHRQGGYRSLLFRVNSTAYHWRKEEQRKALQ